MNLYPFILFIIFFSLSTPIRSISQIFFCVTLESIQSWPFWTLNKEKHLNRRYIFSNLVFEPPKDCPLCSTLVQPTMRILYPMIQLKLITFGFLKKYYIRKITLTCILMISLISWNCNNLSPLLANIVHFSPLRIAISLTVLKHIYWGETSTPLYVPLSNQREIPYQLERGTKQYL